MATTPAGRSEGDEEHWASGGSRLDIDDTAHAAQARMVAGRLVTGPVQGFGKMWQKTYRVRLAGVHAAPPEVIATWKRNFSEFWPAGNRFYAPLTGIAPGEVALLDISPWPRRRPLDRRAGPLRRRRVVHTDDTRGTRPLGLDHVQRVR